MRHFLIIAAFALMLVGCGGTRFMEEGPRLDAPPAGKALVNVHRPSTAYGKGADLIVWRNEEIVGNTNGLDMFQVVVDPGPQVFHAKHYNVSVIKADLEAGKTYDIVCDCGPNFVPFQANYRLWLNAVDAKSDRRELVQKWLEKEKTMVLSPMQEADRLAYQQKQLKDVQKYVADFTTGEKKAESMTLAPSDGR